MTTIKMTFDHFGGPQVVAAGEEELPQPGDGEAPVSIRAIGVNPVDWKVAAGYLERFLPLQLPAAPGCEAAGTVTAVGSGVSVRWVGSPPSWTPSAG